ncbi:hypothetical protein TNCV_677211 [Trichonephila clavipes]|nr:hypothetical protein TNCV_677211 [Trichonephila clavipes]
MFTKRRHYPPTSKSGIHQKQVMLCSWGGSKGIVYYELLKLNKIVVYVRNLRIYISECSHFIAWRSRLKSRFIFHFRPLRFEKHP